MKLITRILVALLLLPCLLYAGQGMGPGPGFKTYSAGGDPTPLWAEDWASTDTDWTESLGDPDTNYTATITGYTEDLFLAARTNATNQELYRDFTMTTAGDISNLRFKIKCPEVPTTTGNRALARFTTSTTARGTATLNYATGLFPTIISSGASTVGTISQFSANTEYWIHIRNQKGTGSNSRASIAFCSAWPCPTATDNNYAESTTGTNIADANRIYIGGGNYSSATSSYNCEIGTVEYWETATW